MRGLCLCFVGIAALSLLACGHGAVKDDVRAEPAGKQRKDEIALSSDLLKGNEHLGAVWMAYGLTKQAVVLKRPAKNPFAGLDDFDTEYEANKAMVFMWTELASEKHATDRYLDTLVAVNKAGFLAEYVLAVFSQPGWTIPAKYLPGLRLPTFFAWAKQNMGEIRVPSLVKVSSATVPEHSAVAGETLPNPEPWAPDRAPCQTTLGPLLKAHNAWLAERKKLEATPLSAGDRAEFLSLVEWASGHVDDYPGGVVWVSTKALAISYYAGYCTVDLNDHRSAVPLLREAISLAPMFAKARSELVQALMVSKQTVPALEEIDKLLPIAKKKCDRGMAWRKRGFILFEMGKLKEAYEAYQKSLEFDPNSPIAYSELRSLANELLNSGQLTKKTQGRYTPPPAGPQTKTHCTDDD